MWIFKAKGYRYLFSHSAYNANRQAGKLRIPIVQSFCLIQLGIEPKCTTLKSDALVSRFNSVVKLLFKTDAREDLIFCVFDFFPGFMTTFVVQCFMNSILQCLSHTIQLRDYCLRSDYEREINTSSPMKGKLMKGGLVYSFVN